MCAILCGLVVAADYKEGQALVSGRDFAANAAWFQDVFEVGRRHKVMNPEKMRTEYGRRRKERRVAGGREVGPPLFTHASPLSPLGKLVYMLMDAADPAIQELLGFSPIRPLRTVHALLEERHGLALLSDPLLPSATAEIEAAGKARAEVQRAIAAKERARAALAARHASATLSSDDVLRCCYSLADNAAFLAHARDPVDRALSLLDARFPVGDGLSAPAPAASLAITSGANGARLTHSHARQHAYVRQSLALWRAIAHDSFRLCEGEKEEGGWLVADKTKRGTKTDDVFPFPQVAPRRRRPARPVQPAPPHQHGARAAEGAAGAQGWARDAGLARRCPKPARRVGREQRRAPWGPQCPERPLLHPKVQCCECGEGWGGGLWPARHEPRGRATSLAPPARPLVAL